MTAPLSLAATAAEVGLSASHFRRVWPFMVRDRAFPAPFRQPPGAHFAWEPELVADWKRRRAGALGESGAHTVANDVHPADRLPYRPTIAHPSSLDTQRATLRQFLKGA